MQFALAGISRAGLPRQHLRRLPPRPGPTRSTPRSRSTRRSSGRAWRGSTGATPPSSRAPGTWLFNAMVFVDKDHRRRGQQRGHPRQGGSLGLHSKSQTGYVLQLRPGGGHRRRAPRRVVPDPGGRVMFASLSDASPSFPLLTTWCLLPGLGALVVALLLPKRRPESSASPRSSSPRPPGPHLWLLAAFKTGAEGFSSSPSTRGSRISASPGTSASTASLLLVVLTGIIFPIAMLGSAPAPRPETVLRLAARARAGCLGVFLALDLFVFFVFFEIVLVPMYFSSAAGATGNGSYAALKFFLFTMFGSALMLVGIISLCHPHARRAATRSRSTSSILAEHPVSRGDDRAVDLHLLRPRLRHRKTPLFPVHTWLPDADGAPGHRRRIGDPRRRPCSNSAPATVALRPVPLPRGLRVGGPTHVVTLGVVSIHLTAPSAPPATEGPQTDSSPYSSVAHPLGLHHCSGIFAHHPPGLNGSGARDGQPRPLDRRLFLLVPASSTNAATRQISGSGPADHPRRRWRRSSRWSCPCCRPSGLPGLNGFVGSS